MLAVLQANSESTIAEANGMTTEAKLIRNSIGSITPEASRGTAVVTLGTVNFLAVRLGHTKRLLARAQSGGKLRCEQVCFQSNCSLRKHYY